MIKFIKVLVRLIIKNNISIIQNALYQIQFEKDIARLKSDEGTNALSYFRKLKDRYFYWVIAKSHHLGIADETLIPSLALEHIQYKWTGACGDEVLKQAFAFYKYIHKIADLYSIKISPESNILDFGVGWGRIVRFFLRDVEGKNLYGTDCYPTAIEICKSCIPQCNFLLNNIKPPLAYPDSTFDVIYLFSVFSHLSEESHLGWLEEFSRCLKPGGLLVATIRPRAYLEMYKSERATKNTKRAWSSESWDKAFPDIDSTIAAYDKGEFCFSGTGGGGPLDASFYGEACISKSYAEKHWAKWFSSIKYFPETKTIGQAIIAAEKST